MAKSHIESIIERRIEEGRKTNSLHLSGFRIGTEGAKILVSILQQGALLHLTSLQVNFGEAEGTESCKLLMNAIGQRHLPNLEELYLSNNNMGDAGMQALVAAVQSKSIPKLAIPISSHFARTGI